MKKICFILALSLLLTGCGPEAKIPSAQLEVLPNDKLEQFHVSADLRQEGDDNFYRAVAGKTLGATIGLELSSGADGQMEYFSQIPADSAARARLRLQFLSTQGVGRVKLSAMDTAGNVLKAVGWVFTGDVPANPDTVWQDLRTNANYLGDWWEQDVSVYDLLQAVPQAAQYRLSVETGKGQHVIITQLGFVNDNSTVLKLVPHQKNYQAQIGETFSLETDVENLSAGPVETEVTLTEPYGLGLVANDSKQPVKLAPYEKKTLSWQVTAKRADEVNMNKPWAIAFAADGQKLSGETLVSVKDTRPGKIFYVMTEDLEPIDSAGYSKAWGNSNGWIDPEEMSVQMISKAERLNEIAGKYGAKWTHYIAWPAVKAAKWAAAQSGTHAWDQVLEHLKQSVVSQSGLGHEYALHMHSDYDPYLSGNILSYNPKTDGFWANHLRHGWAHSIYAEGNFADYDSRTGILYDYQQKLDQLAAQSGKGQMINARAGSFDFGNGSEDEAKSIRAYHHIGLWGSSDADGNAGGITSGDYGNEIYFTKPDDINTRAADIKELGIVEFRPTPKKFLGYDSDSAATLNKKASQGIAAFTSDGKVLPGIHAIVGFTHAMFMMGAGDWRDLEGGQFAVLDQHLQYLKQNFVDQQLLQFATGSELVKNYLDYYSPEPVGLYGKCINSNPIFSEFAIDILGQDIVIDNNHPHEISLKYPLYLRNTAYHIEIFKNGSKIYSTWGLPTPFNDIRFTVDEQATYTMKIYHNSFISGMLKKYQAVKYRLVK